MFGINRTFLIVGLSSLLSGYLTYQYQQNVYENKLNTINSMHQEAIRVEAERTLEKERELRIVGDDVDSKLKEKQYEIEALNNRVASLITAGNFRMRDPGAKASCSSGKVTDTTTTSVNHAEAGTEFSREASEFFWSEATRADKITEQLNACQSYVQSIVEEFNKKQ